MVPLAFVPSARTSSQRTRVALGRGGARADYYHCVFTVMNQVLDNKYLNERYTYRMVDRRLHSTIQWYGPGIRPKPYEPEFDPSEEYDWQLIPSRIGDEQTISAVVQRIDGNWVHPSPHPAIATIDVIEETGREFDDWGASHPLAVTGKTPADCIALAQLSTDRIASPY